MVPDNRCALLLSSTLEARRLSIRAFAAQAGFSYAAMQRFVQGTAIPANTACARIARALGVPPLPLIRAASDCRLWRFAKEESEALTRAEIEVGELVGVRS